MPEKKDEMISFKAGPSLRRALRGVSNRSEFIRAAILAALESACPLCRGTGILSPEQRRHWTEFGRRHRVEECADCHELRLVCDREAAPAARRGRRAGA